MFGAGCFWGVEVAFKKIPGVNSVCVGYSGGTTESPNYEQVCSGQTGHAEVAFVEYDPQEAKLEELLNTFWNIHDPTSLNKQGPDIGTQYRSAIFYYTEAQRQDIEKSYTEINKKLDKEIVTDIQQATKFWKAEEYHQSYLEKHNRA